jgi:Ser/Thr protein kinase RdoA (MazF antagonist)
MRPSKQGIAELVRLASLERGSIETLASSRYPVLRATTTDGSNVVLRLFPWKGTWTSRRDVVDHVAWEHELLAALDGARFPAPRPQHLLAGRSWRQTADGVWAALSYLPGEPLSWRRSPGMLEAGTFMARYHEVASEVVMPVQRPLVVGFDELRRSAPWAALRRLAPDPGALRLLHELIERFDAELTEIASNPGLDRLPIHGDFTDANILVAGEGPRISGVIDFGLAQLAPAEADVAAALWRSGRPDPMASRLDALRVREFIRGYRSVRALGASPARTVPLYLIGRGLQRVVRGALRDDPGCCQPLDQLRWVTTARSELEETISDA